MESWRDAILIRFTPQVSKLTIVFDPDCILQEEILVKLIKRRGFEIIEYEDSISFRFAYESSYRSQWDIGKETDLVVVLRTISDNENDLPYDYLQAGRKVFLSLSDIFKNLSLPVVKTLHPAHYDKLYLAHNDYLDRVLSENETMDFILLHIYEITPHVLKTEAELFKTLLDFHRFPIKVPENILNRLIAILLHKESFTGWEVENFFRDKSLFLKYLQTEWEKYIEQYVRHAAEGIAREPVFDGYNRPNWKNLSPFTHPDIQSRISLLFIEKSLQPVEMMGTIHPSDIWMLPGISNNSARTLISESLAELENLLSMEQITSSDWKHIAYMFAIVSQYMFRENVVFNDDNKRYEQIKQKTDQVFHSWLLENYSALYNLPANPPAMVHHIPKHLFETSEINSKIALIVIDGMSVLQWMCVKDVLRQKKKNLCFSDNTCFAWIPTITSISRQAIFAGKMPMYFSESINSTAKEEKLWSNFWRKNGYESNQVSFFKGLNEQNLDKILPTITNPDTKIIGVVIDKIDKIMHGMELGLKGMLNQVNLWADSGFLLGIINVLHDNNYKVYVTSDHGNIEARGIGSLREGSLVETNGQRARIYNSRELRSAAANNLSESLEWEPSGLPGNFFPLLATKRFAFAKNDEILMTHGGANIEEVMVPFVHISRYDDEQ